MFKTADDRPLHPAFVETRSEGDVPIEYAVFPFAIIFDEFQVVFTRLPGSDETILGLNRITAERVPRALVKKGIPQPLRTDIAPSGSLHSSLVILKRGRLLCTVK